MIDVINPQKKKITLNAKNIGQKVGLGNFSGFAGVNGEFETTQQT